jgi:hypothetical protein
MADGDESERGFTIVDRRGQDEAPEAREAPAGAGAEPEAGAGKPGDAREGAQPLPRADFASLVLSLGTSALYHLGQVDDPETGRRAEPDLPVARHTIDTLEVLQEKTRGNLSEDEEKLLGHLLTDLRLRFVEASR